MKNKFFAFMNFVRSEESSRKKFKNQEYSSALKKFIDDFDYQFTPIRDITVAFNQWMHQHRVAGLKIWGKRQHSKPTGANKFVVGKWLEQYYEL